MCVCVCVLKSACLCIVPLLTDDGKNHLMGDFNLHLTPDLDALSDPSFPTDYDTDDPLLADLFD